jgi:hypothetical protein
MDSLVGSAPKSKLVERIERMLSSQAAASPNRWPESPQDELPVRRAG